MIEVIHSGMYISIQDGGRKGLSQFGVSRGGAMDLQSYHLGNKILGNQEGLASIEVTFGKGKFLFLKPATICITGADFSPTLDEESILMNQSVLVKKDQLLSFGKRIRGVYTYISVFGGIDSEVVLGSRSQFKHITPTYTIPKGTILRKGTTDRRKQKAGINIEEELPTKEETLTCFPGPEFHLLSADQKRQLTRSFRLSKNCNRIGVVLEETIPNNFPQILSSGVLPGTVQITPSGKLIILQRDCQTTGGYPRILQLDEKSVNKLSQKFTDDYIRFSLLNVL